MTTHTRIVMENPDNPDELILDLGEEICGPLGWVEGDTIVWTDMGNGSWQLSKKQPPQQTPQQTPQ
jgi:hypothetical protein